jgi:N6-L-threonylcarbamoyladenine synthase
MLACLSLYNPACQTQPEKMNVSIKPNGLTLLGIETSCDETAAAVVRRDQAGAGLILSNIIRSQVSDHASYGGVVPEIAARAHVELLDQIIARAMREAGIDWRALDGVAATAGPGLIGGLIVGLSTAKAIALVHDLPFIAVNHLEAHALTVGLTDALLPPYLLLIVSGGHTQLIIVRDIGVYDRIGTTLDDALGEAFDKTAKLLGLGFPGGPEVERQAAGGDPARFDFPTPMKGRADPDFSFAGLKTAVRHAARDSAPVSPRDVADLCAGFQRAAISAVCDRVGVAAGMYRSRLGPNAPRTLVVAGGVAANASLRNALQALAGRSGFSLVIPPPCLCTDNAAMIAWAGACHLARGHSDPLDAPARARWPLDAKAPKAIGAGVKA